MFQSRPNPCIVKTLILATSIRGAQRMIRITPSLSFRTAPEPSGKKSSCP
jgi:hypothetical protein